MRSFYGPTVKGDSEIEHNIPRYEEMWPRLCWWRDMFATQHVHTADFAPTALCKAADAYCWAAHFRSIREYPIET